MAKTTVYAVRDTDTKERLTYRYRDPREAVERMRELNFNGRPMEIYRTTQDLPALPRKRKA